MSVCTYSYIFWSFCKLHPPSFRAITYCICCIMTIRWYLFEMLWSIILPVAQCSFSDCSDALFRSELSSALQISQGYVCVYVLIDYTYSLRRFRVVRIANMVMIAQHPCPFQSTTVVVSFPGQNLLSLGPSSPTAFTYAEAWHIYASRG